MVIQDLQTEPSESQKKIDAETTEETIEIVEQDKFQFDSIAKISSLVMLCAGVCVSLAALFIILMPIRSPSPIYFKATEAGQLIKDIPLDKANLPLNILLNWVAVNMMNIHTFNYINYATVIDNAREYFTNEGYESFLAALRDNKVVELVINNKLVMRGVPASAPQVTKEGILANFYLWKIKVPMTFRYRNVDTDRFDDVELTLLIVRVPTTEAPYGVRILKYDMVLTTQ